jgi:hypothetical protein
VPRRNVTCLCPATEETDRLAQLSQLVCFGIERAFEGKGLMGMPNTSVLFRHFIAKARLLAGWPAKSAVAPEQSGYQFHSSNTRDFVVDTLSPIKVPSLVFRRDVILSVVQDSFAANSACRKAPGRPPLSSLAPA